MRRDTSRTNVPAGTYTLTASSVVAGGNLHLPSLAQQAMTVLPSLASINMPITDVETARPILDFSIRSAYRTPATQPADGRVPTLHRLPRCGLEWLDAGGCVLVSAAV